MGFYVFSQSYEWREVAIKNRNFSNEDLKFRKSVPEVFKVYRVDYRSFKELIISDLKTQSTIVKFPTEQGVQKFLVKEVPSLSGELSKKFPKIVPGNKIWAPPKFVPGIILGQFLDNLYF